MVFGACAVFVLVAVSAAAGAVGRTVGARRARRRSATEAAVEPLALALLEGEEVDTALDRRQAAALEGLLLRYAGQLAGPTRGRIAGKLEAAGVVDRELRALGARRATVRARAAAALGVLGAARAAPALIEALTDDDGDVRAAAVRALASLGDEQAVAPIVEVIAARIVPHAIGADALLRLGSTAHEALVELAAADDPHIRAVAIEALGLAGNGSPRVVARIHSGFNDPAAAVRAEAARALGRIGAEGAAPALVALLRDRMPIVRAAAAGALGVIGERSAFEALLEAASGRDFEVGTAAARALARLDFARAESLADAPGMSYVAAAVDEAAVRR